MSLGRLCFKNISQLPSHFAFFLDFSHLFSYSDNFFRDPWVPLTFFPAATFAVIHFPIKIREQNIVLTQHSAKAHTSPLSEKRRLSHARGSHVTSTICRICWQRYYFLLWVLIGFDLGCSCKTIIFMDFSCSKAFYCGYYKNLVSLVFFEMLGSE